jgi:hypothetical protein
VVVILTLLLATTTVSDHDPTIPAGTTTTAYLRERTEAAAAPARSALRAAATPHVAHPPPRSRAVAPQVKPPPPPPAPEPEPEPEPAPEPESVSPVGGLDQRQMDHAATIVAMGQRAGLPEYAYVIAIATALQESYLRNLANPNLPESLNHPNDGTGTDHDSVGLFQQRSSTGWGSVAQLMDPSYAATKFYEALARVSGWQDLAATVAAQAVQRSAYPDAYAKHEPLARQIVAALT